MIPCSLQSLRIDFNDSYKHVGIFRFRRGSWQIIYVKKFGNIDVFIDVVTCVRAVDVHPSGAFLDSLNQFFARFSCH